MWIPVNADPRRRTEDLLGQERLADAVRLLESEVPPRSLLHRCHDKWQGGQMMQLSDSVVLETLFDTNKKHEYTIPGSGKKFTHKRKGLIFFTLDVPYVFTKATKDAAYAFGFVSVDLRSHPNLARRIAKYLIWNSHIPGLDQNARSFALERNPRLKYENGVHTIGIPKRGWLKFRTMVGVYMHHFPTPMGLSEKS